MSLAVQPGLVVFLPGVSFETFRSMIFFASSVSMEARKTWPGANPIQVFTINDKIYKCFLKHNLLQKMDTTPYNIYVTTVHPFNKHWKRENALLESLQN